MSTPPSPSSPPSAAVAAALSLYSSPSDAALRATLDQHYTRDAIFEDAMLKVAGTVDVAAQFAALRAFKSVDVTARAPPSTDAGGATITFPSTQRYTLPLLLVPIVLEVDTALHLAPDGRIQRHVDTWRRVRVGGGPALPAVAAPALWRAGVGRASSALLRAGGVGCGGVRGGLAGAVRRAMHAHGE